MSRVSRVIRAIRGIKVPCESYQSSAEWSFWAQWWYCLNEYKLRRLLGEFAGFWRQVLGLFFHEVLLDVSFRQMP